MLLLLWKKNQGRFYRVSFKSLLRVQIKRVIVCCVLFAGQVRHASHTKAEVTPVRQFGCNYTQTLELQFEINSTIFPEHSLNISQLWNLNSTSALTLCNVARHWMNYKLQLPKFKNLKAFFHGWIGPTLSISLLFATISVDI